MVQEPALATVPVQLTWPDLHNIELGLTALVRAGLADLQMVYLMAELGRKIAEAKIQAETAQNSAAVKPPAA